MKSRSGGFTLAETVIAVLVGGAVLVGAGQLMKPAGTSGSGGQHRQVLDSATSGLAGLVSATSHLPEAEDGWLPSSLGGNGRVRYFVAPAFTRSAEVRYNPHGLVPAEPETQGLDFCLHLAQARPDELLEMGSGSDMVRVVAMLEYSSSSPLANSPSEVALPGSALARAREAEGRYSRGIAPAEIFTALSCPDRLARMAAATNYLWAAEDILELAKANAEHMRVGKKVFDAQMDEAWLGYVQMYAGAALLAMDFANMALSHGGLKPYVDEVFYLVNVGLYGAALGLPYRSTRWSMAASTLVSATCARMRRPRRLRRQQRNGAGTRTRGSTTFRKARRWNWWAFSSSDAEDEAVIGACCGAGPVACEHGEGLVFRTPQAALDENRGPPCRPTPLHSHSTCAHAAPSGVFVGPRPGQSCSAWRSSSSP